MNGSEIVGVFCALCIVLALVGLGVVLYGDTT